MNGKMLEPLEYDDPVDLNAKWWTLREIVRCQYQPMFWDLWVEDER